MTRKKSQKEMCLEVLRAHKNKKLSQKELKKILRYNKKTGQFKWIKPTSKKFLINSTAGGLNDKGYVCIGINKRRYPAHRLAWLYEYGKFPKNEIDHINHIRDDNRLNNLRIVKHAENGRNVKLKSNNISGFHGVSFKKDHNKWQAVIGVDNAKIFLGYFNNKSEASVARKVAEKQYGFHKNHGIN